MDFSLDKVADALYIKIFGGQVKESDEISPGIVVDYSPSRDIVGVEILEFTSRNYNLNALITLNEDKILPAVVKCA